MRTKKKQKPDEVTEPTPAAQQELPLPGASQSTTGDATDHTLPMEASVVQRVAPAKLCPHPVNLQLYGHEQLGEQFMESVRARGVITPLHVTTASVVLSGHRRLRAAIALGLPTVPVIVIDLGNPLEQEEYVLEANRARTKTTEEQVREFICYERIESERAKQRKGQRTDLVPKSAPGQPGGKARDIAADKVGIAGSTAAKGAEVVLLIDAAVRAENLDQAMQLREALNGHSINAAHRLARDLGLIAQRPSSRAAKPKGAHKRDGQNGSGAVVAKPEDQSTDGADVAQTEAHGEAAASQIRPSCDAADASEESPPASPARPEEVAAARPCTHASDEQTQASATAQPTGQHGTGVTTDAVYVLADDTEWTVDWTETRLLPVKEVQALLDKVKKNNPDPFAGGFRCEMAGLLKYQKVLVEAGMFLTSRLPGLPADNAVEMMSDALTKVRNTMEQIHQNK